ncbi:MAG TPA: GNAT family N-acetyltransferase [Acidimicrobiia bacterium]|jgi:GNAT superfamily N-acetyltransferase
MPALRVSGTWPGVVRFQRGWASATALPWNDSGAWASLRLDRGGAGFLTAAALWLRSHGAEEVRSPAVDQRTGGVWERAGFKEKERFRLFERDLSRPLFEPERVVDQIGLIPFRLVEIDDDAFAPEYRLGQLGLESSLDATREAVVLTVGDPVAGFCIVGSADVASFLQRIAVDPQSQRQGIGTDLIRAAMKWARKRGAWSMSLNTHRHNPAAGLYAREGFEESPHGVCLFAFDQSSAAVGEVKG